MSKKALANTNELPAHLQAYGTDSSDEIVVDGQSTPYIKIIHNDPEKGNMGEFYCSEPEANLGNKLDITVVDFEYIWRSYEDDQYKESKVGGVWPDGTQMTEDETWKNKNLDLYVLLPGDDIPKRLSIKGANFKVGNSILMTIKKIRGPIFAKKFGIFTQIVKKGNKTYSELHFEVKGFCSEEEASKAATIREMLLGFKNAPNSLEVKDAPIAFELD